MDSLELASPSPLTRLRKKRLHKDPVPRFKPDISEQLDAVWGCASVQLPPEHPARVLKGELERIDVSSVVARYSSQGRRGFHPRHMLGALVYASQIGLHHSTEIARAMRTDVALRFVAGGHAISAGRLRAFRRENKELFALANQQTLAVAARRGLLDVSEMAVDSVRLRAHASMKAVGTLKRSTARLEELAKVNVGELDEMERARHEEKVRRHQTVVRLCGEQKRTNVVATSQSAGFMKFPSGASAPGHRVTTVGCGTKHRLIIDVLVDGDSTDYGKLGPAILKARQTLQACGVPLDKPMQIAGDAGYFSSEDLLFAAQNRPSLDVLIAEGTTPRRRSETGERIFGVDDFERREDAVFCPAGREMSGPFRDGERERWEGRGCATCGLKNQCTRGTRRSLTIDHEFQRARASMLERFAQSGARERYNKRIATIEPIFSGIEDRMKFRRVSSRKQSAVEAEIQLQVLAYNLGRLACPRRLRHVRMAVDLLRCSPLLRAA